MAFFISSIALAGFGGSRGGGSSFSGGSRSSSFGGSRSYSAPSSSRSSSGGSRASTAPAPIVRNTQSTRTAPKQSVPEYSGSGLGHTTVVNNFGSGGYRGSSGFGMMDYILFWHLFGGHPQTQVITPAEAAMPGQGTVIVEQRRDSLFWPIVIFFAVMFGLGVYVYKHRAEWM
jgi:hypothetical protein